MDNMNKVVKKLPGRLCTFLCTGFIGLAVLLFYCLLPVAFIIIGAIYWDASNCRAANIPGLLIAGGVLGILANLITTIERRNKKNFEKPIGFWLQILSGLIGLATFAWLIAACVIIFPLHPNIEHKNESSEKYCHPFLYDFSFWSLVVILVLLVLHLIVVFSIAFCCAEKIIKKLAKREAKAGVVNFISNA